MEELTFTKRIRLFLLLSWLGLLPLLVLVYYPALQSPFLLDDSGGIVGNAEFRSFSAHNLMMLFRNHGDNRAYDHHAVPAFVSMVDQALWGVDPFGYHLTNLAIHWVNCGLVLVLFFLIWRHVAGDAARWQALWIGVSLMAIWAVHPFSTMSVAYITCRTESLMTLFYVLALIAFLSGWEWSSIPLGVAAILSKEVAVTLPGAILMVDWARGGVGIIPTLLGRWRYYTGLTTVWLVMIAYHLRGGRRQSIGGDVMPLASVSEYFKVECGIIASYFGKLVWPMKLQFYPFYRPVTEWQQWVPQLVGIVIYLGIGIYLLRRWRWLAIAMLFPLLVLLPTSTFIPIPLEPAMEYRMYLPSVALLGLILVGLWRWVSPMWVRIALVCAATLSMAVVSHLRSRDYESIVTLNEQQVSVDPRSLSGLEALAGAYSSKGLIDRAIATAEKMLDYALADKNKEYAGRAFNLLGSIESDRKNYPAARDYFRRSYEMAGSGAAQMSLANMHVQLYELKEADKILDFVLAMSPDQPNAMLLSFESKMSAKDYPAAEKILDRFFELYPERRAELDVQRTRLMHFKRKQSEGTEPLSRPAPR